MAKVETLKLVGQEFQVSKRKKDLNIIIPAGKKYRKINLYMEVNNNGSRQNTKTA